MTKEELLLCPQGLNEPAAEIWGRVAPAAVADGRLNETTRATFAAYCEVRAVADGLRKLEGRIPPEFPDPVGDEVVHPVLVAMADMSEAALEMEKALGIGAVGEAALRERGGKLGGLSHSRFNQLHPADVAGFLGYSGPRVVKDGDKENS